MNPDRPTFEHIYMNLAFDLSRRSTCRRMKVGCAIVSPDFTRVIAVGYNGNVPGGANDCDVHGPDAVGRCGCLHAEENAIINCDVPKETPKVLLCTHLPCVMCAKRIVRVGGVQRVIYATEYRNQDAVNILRERGIEVHFQEKA